MRLIFKLLHMPPFCRVGETDAKHIATSKEYLPATRFAAIMSS
jgi:hypothetical protein